MHLHIFVTLKSNKTRHFWLLLLCCNAGQRATNFWEWQACEGKCCQVPHSLDLSRTYTLVIEKNTSCPGMLVGEEGVAALSMKHFVAVKFFFHDFLH